MKKNNIRMNANTQALPNRKRSLRWVSEETKLYKKYGVKGHRYAITYINIQD